MACGRPQDGAFRGSASLLVSQPQCASRHQKRRLPGRRDKDRYRNAFSCRDRVAIATLCPVATGLLSWCLSRQGCYRNALPRCDRVAVAVPFPVAMGWLALRTFRWGTRQVTWLHSVTEGDTFVAVSWRRCQEGHLVRACLGWPTALLRVHACLVLAGLVMGYKPAVQREVVSVVWDPHPREPVEGMLQATSVLELTADLADSGAEGKTSHAVVLGVGPQLGPDTVVVLWCFCGGSVSLFRGGGGRSQAGEQREWLVCPLGCQWRWLGCCCCDDVSSRCFQVLSVALACTAVIAWPCLVSVGIVGLALLARASDGFRFSALSVRVLGGSACGPSTLWRSEVVVLVVRRRSHLVVAWSRRVRRVLGDALVSRRGCPTRQSSVSRRACGSRVGRALVLRRVLLSRPVNGPQQCFVVLRCLVVRRLSEWQVCQYGLSRWRSVAFWLPKVKSLGRRSPSLSFFPLPLPPTVLRLPLSPSCVSGEEEGRAWCCGVVDLAWSEEEVTVRREGPSWVRFFVTVTEGDTFVAVSWQRCQEGRDPRPREPVEGVLRATSVLELAVHVWDAEGFGVLSWRRPDSPLSHCLSLRWFRSHVVVSGVRPQFGQAAVLRVLCVSVAALSRPCAGAEAGARLASRVCGLRVPLLAASGSGLVAIVVTAQTRASGGSRFGVLSVPWSHSWVPARDGTGVCSFPTWRCVWGPGWFCLCAEHCFRFVPDSVGFCGSRVCATTLVGGRGVVLSCYSGRGSSSRELGVRRVAEAAVAPCVVSSSESERLGYSYYCTACVASMVAWCVRAVLARLAVDSLAVVFPYGGHLQSAWALPVKASCAWPCFWLLRWPACLVVRFQVFSAVLADFVCPRGSGGPLYSCARRALADGGLVSVVVLGWMCFVWKCQSHVVVLPLACGRDSCVPPSSAFRRLLGVVVLHYGVVLPGVGADVACCALSGLRFLAYGFRTLCCVVCLFVSFVRRFTSLLGVGGVELSASGTLGVGLCLVVVPLPLWGGCFACLVVVPWLGLGPFEVDVLLSASAVVLVFVWLCVFWVVNMLIPALSSVCAWRVCCQPFVGSPVEVSDFGLTSGVFRASVAVCHVVEHVTPSFCGSACVWFRWQRSALLTGVSRVAVGNCALCWVLLATEWVAGSWVTIVRSVGDCNCEDFGWRFLLFGPDLASLGTWGFRSVWAPHVYLELKALASDPLSPSLSLSLRRCSASPSPSSVSGEEEGRAWCCGVVDLAWSKEEVVVHREGSSWVRFFVTGRDFLCPSRSGWIGSPSWFIDSFTAFSMLPSPLCCVWMVCGRPEIEDPVGMPPCWCRDGSVHRDIRGGVVCRALLSRSGTPRGSECFPGADQTVPSLSRPYAGAEAGARLASRTYGLRVPLLVASEGGSVTVVVTAFSSRRFRVFLVALACTAVLAWLCLAPVGVVGLALGKPVLLVVPASVFSRFRGPILGSQPVMAPACVASRPGGVSGVRGGSACGPSTL
ncbi:hypothetical protein Taro_016573 [Colocasia esculenta]|uniref:Uncharacterized protein n=1 Tax=Colocasia esculenta TaxID=4460 RepID=A0A843UTC6_COLES|nr:hypothetical protein [Colocasia esculenta]